VHWEQAFASIETELGFGQDYVSTAPLELVRATLSLAVSKGKYVCYGTHVQFS
jgi:hypothetical protein